MKFTDKFFRFPKRMADDSQLIDLANRMKQGEDINNVVINTMDSYVRIKPEDIDLWEEAYPPETEFSELAELGLQTTMVVSLKHGDFMCSWNIKKFEEELNKHMERLNNSSSNSI